MVQHMIDKQTFLILMNALRRLNRDKWYVWEGIVENKTVQVKAFNTWLQVFRINGIQQNTLMDISVRQFNATILNSF